MIETIKKCDCCGAIEKDFDNEFGSILIKHPVDLSGLYEFNTYGYINSSSVDNRIYDLCPKCIEAIESFIGEDLTPEVKEDE